ncbi:hypothetical protein O0L34_g2383 [Tuta absoluta]|nr:hypothetical protein O0L34_g2383 [Tuta absoluta]
MKRSFSSEGGASSKRDWKTRLSLRSRSGHSVDGVRGRRCASLRASTPARGVAAGVSGALSAGGGSEDSGRSTPAHVRASPSPADAPAPKKSNWEVIEHFSSSRSKKSPTAVSFYIHTYINHAYIPYGVGRALTAVKRILTPRLTV